MSPGRVAQSVTCLVTDAKLTADPGVASSIPARSHTFVEIDHEIISTVILLPSAESFMKGCYQLQAKVCARLLVNCLLKLAQEKSAVRWSDRPAMTIAVDLGRKATKQTNKNHVIKYCTTVYERDGNNLFWSIKNSGEILNKLKSRGFLASCLHTISLLSILHCLII